MTTLFDHILCHPIGPLTARVVMVVGARLNCTIDQLMAPGRHANRIGEARQVCYLLSYELLGMSKSDIGRAFHRDHTTVIHGLRTIRNRLRVDGELSGCVIAIRQELLTYGIDGPANGVKEEAA
jgi:chromosomal replication initiation ATPase DnaA